MKIATVKIHNYRSIADAEFCLANYSLIIGENNAGKTTVINALRTFYEDDKQKYDQSRDFPKFEVADQSSWLEITYKLTEQECGQLKEEYQQTDRLLKVRRYFATDDKTLSGNLYAYVGGELTHEHQFYGTTKVGLGKLGTVLYIPALSKTEEGLKLTGPSPLKNLIDLVFGKVMSTDVSYQKLSAAFSEFNQSVLEEDLDGGHSLHGLSKEINSEISQFGLSMDFSILPIQPADIVKSLVAHDFKDVNLDSALDNATVLGQGVQRHLIYTLLKLTTKYASKATSKKKDFQPDFTLLLFEEPEAFLHPAQQENLNSNLKTLGGIENNQVLITSHSTTFTSRNVKDICNIIRVCKRDGRSSIHQIREDSLDDLLDQNAGLYKRFCDMLTDSDVDEGLKKQIRGKWGHDMPNMNDKLIDEGLKYFLWLDSERSAMFFAKHVIVCEGASEKILIEYMLCEEWSDLRGQHIYCVDALGKFNIHRYVNLLGALGIDHSIIMDKDQNRGVHKEVNEFIEDKKNAFTKHIHLFDVDLEHFLEVEKPPKGRNDMKPSSLMRKFESGDIAVDKLAGLRSIVATCAGCEP